MTGVQTCALPILREVFACLKDAGLKLKPGKCESLKESVKYLGRVIDKYGMYPDPDQVQSVQDWMEPRNHKEMQSFLGLPNYYRDFTEITPSITPKKPNS